MKTITKTEAVQATRRVVTYQCDNCEFTADKSWKVEQHEAATHTDIQTISHGSFEFYKAKNQHALDKYISAINHGVSVSITWEGPGWYCISNSHEDYDKTVTFYLRKAKIHLEDVASNARKTLQDIEEIESQKLLEE